MRSQHMFRKFRFYCMLLLSITIIGTVDAQKKFDKEGETVIIHLKVIDGDGMLIPKVQLVVGEGTLNLETDEKGAASLKVNLQDFITISKHGYGKITSLVTELLKESTVKLEKTKLFMTSDDDIPLPFITLNKRHLTGNGNVIKGEQLEKYPSTDIRNALTGLSTGVEVIEKNGSPGSSPEDPSGKNSISTRGGNMMYVIDDIPLNVTEMPLDPGEIESVTMINDIVGKAMFGPAGADGIIYIKTKRGKMNERTLKFNIEDGVSMVDRFPQWVNGTDYARLNNQARINSGLSPLYSDNDIAAYALNNPYDPYHPNINFRDMMLKNAMSIKRANFSATGGNDGIQYSAYLGYNGEGDIFKIGPTSNYNRISARSNLDIKINDFIKVKFGINGGLSFRRSSNYDFNTAINDINTIPAIAFPVYANNDPSLNSPWYSVTPTYPMNPIANLIQTGNYTEKSRTAASNLTIEFDLKKIALGLTARTYIGMDVLNLLRIGQAKNYIAYTGTKSITANGADTIILSKVHDGVDVSTFSDLNHFYTQRYAVYQNFSYNRIFGIHDIQSSLTYYLYKVTMDGLTESQRQQNAVWTGMYTYNDKYTINGVLNYAGTYSFAPGEKYELFPSLGLSWLISEEGFMSKIKFINYLKLRVQAGILGDDNNQAPFYFRDNWYPNTASGFGPYSSNQWFGSTTSTLYTTLPYRTGNPDLTWEKRKEMSIGLDAMMFDQKLSVEVSYYNNLHDGQITQVSNSIPYFVGVSNALPLINYNKTRFYGLETGLQFTNNFGKFKYSIGGNATIQNSKIEKYDEPNYRFAYQYHTGTAADTYWGLNYIGKFQSDADAIKVPQLYDFQLHQGDLQYKDMNGDGVIDDNDRVAIGHTTPRLFYALNVKLSYKNFELTIIGTGRAFYDIALTNSYYWNGWGNNNYSKFVLDNIGGAYPNLTYNKVNNNFQASSFWLTKGDYFKIQNVELAYTLSPNQKHLLGTKGIRFYLRGANLLTISHIKDVDPESINSGITTYPLFRTFTCGIKLNF